MTYSEASPINQDDVQWWRTADFGRTRARAGPQTLSSMRALMETRPQIHFIKSLTDSMTARGWVLDDQEREAIRIRYNISHPQNLWPKYKEPSLWNQHKANEANWLEEAKWLPEDIVILRDYSHPLVDLSLWWPRESKEDRIITIDMAEIGGIQAGLFRDCTMDDPAISSGDVLFGMECMPRWKMDMYRHVSSMVPKIN